MDPNVSLKLSKRADETIWGKAISGVGRVFYSSTFNVYSFLISRRRNAVLRAYKNYSNINSFKDEIKRNQVSQKYKESYDSYIAIIEKYIVESIYTKMQKGASTLEENNIMSKYYEVKKYKGEDEVEFNTRLQILTLNMDWDAVQAHKSDSYLEKYKDFYLYKIVELYKAHMRHSAIILANAKEGSRDEYEAIYAIIEKYIKEVIPILPEKDETNRIIKEYKKYVAPIDQYETKQYLQLRKRLSLLGFSNDLFEYSLPLVAKEDCYKEIIEIARTLITNYYTDIEKFECYGVLLDAIEEYIDNIQYKKAYWNSDVEKAEFKKIDKKWQVMKKLARIDYESFKKQREILFIEYDKKIMDKNKIKLPEVRNYYHERLLILNALPKMKNKPALISGVMCSNRRIKVDNVINQNQEKTGALIIGEAKEEEQTAEQKLQLIENALNFLNDKQDEKQIQEEAQETIQDKINDGAKAVYNVASFLVGGNKKYKRRRSF